MNRSPDANSHEVRAAATADALAFSLLHAARSLGSSLDAGLASVGSSLPKHGVLTVLVEAGEPVALSELASYQGCVRSNITQLVDRLEADGLVERVHDPSDRRSVRARLTPAGRERQAAGSSEIAKVTSAFAEGLSATDRAALDRALRALE